MKTVSVETIKNWKKRTPTIEKRVELDIVKETQNLYMGIVLSSLFG